MVHHIQCRRLSLYEYRLGSPHALTSTRDGFRKLYDLWRQEKSASVVPLPPHSSLERKCSNLGRSPFLAPLPDRGQCTAWTEMAPRSALLKLVIRGILPKGFHVLKYWHKPDPQVLRASAISRLTQRSSETPPARAFAHFRTCQESNASFAILSTLLSTVIRIHWKRQTFSIPAIFADIPTLCTPDNAPSPGRLCIYKGFCGSDVPCSSAEIEASERWDIKGVRRDS